MNYRLTISYDGTRYHGWESKKEVDTIEGKLEAVFARMTEQDVKIHGAGRTDAGVHAMGMVANGFLDTTLTPEEIKAYANHYLPDDICIREVSGVSERFHARLNAKGKVYQYTCYIGDEKPVFERLLESSSSMHAWIDSFYIDGVVKGQIETAQLMDKIPVLYILLVILGILELMMVKSSGIRHIKMFSKNKQTNAVVFLMPALVIYVWEGFIRRNILSEIIKNGDSQRMTINEYLTGYYIGNKIFFNWSWMIMLLIATIICIIIQSGIIKGLSGRAGMLAGIGIPALVTIMPSVIYAFNPPALFGYITLDISLCDMTDNAFYMYLVTFCMCMTAAYILIYLVISGLLDMRKLAGIFVINVVISVILMIIVSGKSSLAIQYMPWIVADCASVILAFICVAVKPVNKKMAELCGASKKV